MKIGVVGTGMIAQLVVPHLTAWGCPVAAICGIPGTEEQIRELAAAAGAAGEFTDYDEMLRDGDVGTVYIAVPNALHFRFTMQALQAGKHAIVEKPLCSNVREAEELAACARERGLFLFEAITTLHLPNFAKVRELLGLIGDIKVASANYSQYSSRYDAFRRGETLPAFDPAKSGGALMDLGLYNLHYLLGLFGTPERVAYRANIERGIDTSGIVTLDYGMFQAVSIAAKNCAAPVGAVIQGTKGYLQQETPANRCGEILLHLNDGTEERFDVGPDLQWESEFRVFAAQMAGGDLPACYELLDHSLAVSRLMTELRMQVGVVFAADEQGR